LKLIPFCGRMGLFDEQLRFIIISHNFQTRQTQKKPTNIRQSPINWFSSQWANYVIYLTGFMDIIVVIP
jgi:carbohydrate-selective porin OprB